MGQILTMHTRNMMIMLMHDEMATTGMPVPQIQSPKLFNRDRDPRPPSLRSRFSGEMGREVSQVVRHLRLARLDGGKTGRGRRTISQVSKSRVE